MIITKEKIEEIFENTESFWEEDNAFQGLQILSEYTWNLIQGADLDIIYSVKIDEIIKLGITEEDIIKLAKLNWFISDGRLSCFV